MFVGKVIFYLWNDVFKDYEFEGDAFNDVEGKLTFDKFYKTVDGTTSVVEEKVALFLKNLEVKIVKEDIVDDEADDVPIDGNGVSKHKSLRSVKFQDGTLFSTEEMSHFDVYLESLKKIGLERVQPIVANMKYRRKNCPMISLEEMPDIVNSNFKYHKEGDYYYAQADDNDYDKKAAEDESGNLTRFQTGDNIIEDTIHIQELFKKHKTGSGYDPESTDPADG